MNKTVILLFKEFKCLFKSPMFYIVGAVFSFLNGYAFWILVNLMHGPVGETADNVVAVFFGGTLFFWIALLLIIPLITMRSISEEKNNGTLDLLFSANVSETQIIISKFLSILLVYLVLWMPTTLYIIFMSRYGVIDINLVLSSYVGISLLGIFMISLGVFTSALSRNPIVSASITFILLLLLFSVGFLKSFIGDTFVIKLLDSICLMKHMSDFTSAVIDSRTIMYYISFSILNLYLSTRVLCYAKKN